MKIIALIPARYQSTRFPAKPLALIAGLPMIQQVYQRALTGMQLDGVYVATDDQRIAQCVEGFGGKVVMTAAEHPSGTDRIAEAARKLGLAADDLIVNIQGDQPAFQPDHIADLLKPLLADRNILMSTLKYRIRDPEEINNPNHVKVVDDKDGFALYFSRAAVPFYRDLPGNGIYYKHLGFYGYRFEFLNTFTGLPVGLLEAGEKLEQLRALENGYRIKVVETAHDSMEVDTPADVPKVEALIRRPAGTGPRP